MHSLALKPFSHPPQQLAGQCINRFERTLPADFDAAIAPDALIIIKIDSRAFSPYCFSGTVFPAFSA